MDEWVDVAGEAEFDGADRKRVAPAPGLDVLLLKVEGAYYAVRNVCTHAQALLSDGEREGFEIECPLHGSRFDVRTGRPRTPPAVQALATHAVKVEDGRIFVKL